MINFTSTTFFGFKPSSKKYPSTIIILTITVMIIENRTQKITQNRADSFSTRWMKLNNWNFDIINGSMKGKFINKPNQS